MNIDETIKKYKCIANTDSSCPRYCMLPCDECVQECKQVAEWLEELKIYKSGEFSKNLQELVYKQGYNKAIDNFYNALGEDLIWIKERFGDDAYTNLWCDVGIRAEQLKESNKE